MTVTGLPFLMPVTDALAASRLTIDADLEVVVPLLSSQRGRRNRC